MNTKKKIAIAVIAVGLITTLTIGGTLAYFTDKDAATNVITLGNVNGDLSEDPGSNSTTSDGGVEYPDVKPGDTLKKAPKVTLGADSADAYLRIKIDYSWASTESGSIDLTDTQLADMQKSVADALNAGWYYNSADGYYYYNAKLTKGGSATIFDTIKLSSEWGNEVANKSLNMKVTAYLIQADNLKTTTVDVNGTTYINGWQNDSSSAITESEIQDYKA